MTFTAKLQAAKVATENGRSLTVPQARALFAELERLHTLMDTMLGLAEHGFQSTQRDDDAKGALGQLVDLLTKEVT